MICPHCSRTIREEDQNLMARRVPKGEPLPDGMKTLGFVGACIIVFLVLTYLFYLYRIHT